MAIPSPEAFTDWRSWAGRVTQLFRASALSEFGGTVPGDRIGASSAPSGKFLRDDGTWQSVSSGPGGAGDPTSWGSITGTLSAQTDLQNALNGKQAAGSYAAAVHGHAIADVTGLQSALDGKQAAGAYAAASHTHTAGQVSGLVAPIIAYKSDDQLNIGITYADVTGTGISVAANKAYAFDFVLWCTADAATTGIDVAVNGPAAPTAIRYTQEYWTSATARTERGAVAYDANTASTGSQGNVVREFRVRGVLVNGANAGTLIARAKRENVGSGPNVLAGSYGMAWLLN